MPRGRRDSNEREIVDGLRRAGASVVQLEDPDVPGLMDLLVGYQGVDRTMEIKLLGHKLDPDQVSFHRAWRGRPPITVHSLEEAFAALGIAAYGIDRMERNVAQAGRVRPLRTGRVV